MIQEQVRLPIRVAFEVVMQGIRIRFGRSMVTILGVMLGIAFLMSILTGQALKRGVGEEEVIRTEVGRMANFLAAEMGPPAERTVGLVLNGQPSTAELRLLRHLTDNGLQTLRWAGYNNASLPPMSNKLDAQNVPVQQIGDKASAILVLGAGELPNLPWAEILANARQQVVGVSANRAIETGDTRAVVVQLEREARPEEIARENAAKKKERYRGIWIIAVSLLVTIIGIANAMLMSVTERFREIGTMKCLGALSAFVRLMFLIESGFMGVVGGLAGCLVGVVFSIVAYMFSYGPGLTLLSLGKEFVGLLGYMGLSICAGIVLSIIAAIYPASVASRMVPADALRSNV